METLFDQFDGAFAENTLRAYRSDFKYFADWCAGMNINPTSATPDDIANYVVFMSRDLKPATIARRLASLSSVLSLNDLSDPTGGSAVKLAVKRMHRSKGRAQDQAVPLTKDVLAKLLAACGNDVLGKRDTVMLLLGYETMRRRAELCQFRFEDIVNLPGGKTAIKLRFSKTDQYGQGKLLPVSTQLLESMQEWGKYCPNTGFILRGISRNGGVRNTMSPANINLRLKALQKRAQLKLDGELSGHSFRVGAAIDLLEEGETLERIMLRGGWTSESSAIRYLRAWQAV